MKVVAYSDVGKVRYVNQDNIFYTLDKIGDLDNLFILCDGMGGANAGEYASFIAIKYIKDFISTNKGEVIDLFTRAIKKTNDSMLNEAKKDINKSGMGTTLVLASIKENILYIANIGDSRLYIITDVINQISKDHTVAEELLLKNSIHKSSLEYTKNKHVLTRALGAMENIKADFFEASLNHNDKILLCSDGLSNMLSDDEIRKIILNTKEENIAAELINNANLKGGEDNISAIVIYDLCNKVGDINAT